MNMNEIPFMEWYWSERPTAQERQLVDMVFKYEDLFADMLFSPGSETYELIKCKSKNAETGEWIDDEISRPDELAYFSETWFSYKVEELEDDYGYYDHEKQLLCVSPEGLAEGTTVLHEMIHMHERIINELPIYFHDMLLWALYQKLRKSVPKLDEIITNHAHLLTQSSIYSIGGTHDIIFLLKSFDLDIRMGLPLGSVFGYGRRDDFKDYEYRKA